MNALAQISTLENFKNPRIVAPLSQKASMQSCKLHKINFSDGDHNECPLCFIEEENRGYACCLKHNDGGTFSVARNPLGCPTCTYSETLTEIAMEMAMERIVNAKKEFQSISAR